MNDDPLEQRIANALADRATSLAPIGHVAAIPQRRRLPRRASTPVRLGVAIVATIAIAAAVVVATIGSDGGSRSSIRTGRGVGQSQSDSNSLSLADGAAIQSVIRTNQSLTGSVVVAPGTEQFAVQAPGADPVVVAKGYAPTASGARAAATSGCITVVASTPTAAGYQGICTAPGQAGTELAVSSDGSPLSAAGKWYFVWTQVPDGAAYVTFSTSKTLTKQVPLKGVAYFTETGVPSQLAPDPPIARAYDRNGKQLGEAHVPQWQLDTAKGL